MPDERSTELTDRYGYRRLLKDWLALRVVKWGAKAPINPYRYPGLRGLSEWAITQRHESNPFRDDDEPVFVAEALDDDR